LSTYQFLDILFVLFGRHSVRRLIRQHGKTIGHLGHLVQQFLITIVQTVALSGAIIVTTPQEVALIDARKAATMFEKVNVPVLGLVENMSYFVSPSDNKRYDIFGSGGGEREAKRLGVPLLGQVPIDIATREAGDRGQPIVGQDRQSPVAVEFMTIAQRIREALA